MSSGNSRGGRSGNRSKQPLPRSVQVSKKLSWLLRHGAEIEGLKLDSGGFINLQDVLDNRNLRSLQVTFEEVRQTVEENDKQRFTMLPVSSSEDDDTTSTEANGEATPSGKQPAIPSTNPKDYKIRANQGHSLKLDSESLLQPLTLSDLPLTAVHGTNHGAYARIMASGGLKAMGRNHIHFASGLPAGFQPLTKLESPSTASPPVISGMRNSSTVLVFLDVRKAMEAGLKFWRSDNGVVLTEGNVEGVVPVEFFERVEDRTGEGVLVQDGVVVKEVPKHWAARGKGKG